MLMMNSMPIYEYECQKCGQTIEVIQKMSDPDLKKHQQCGGTLTKLLSVPAVQVKDHDPYLATKHPSVLQQAENERRAAERKKKAAPIINAPAGARPGAKSNRTKSKTGR
jgi:putative FmdB family regulatory protein